MGIGVVVWTGVCGWGIVRTKVTSTSTDETHARAENSSDLITRFLNP